MGAITDAGQEQIKLRISAELNAQVDRLAGRRTSKSAWIEDAIRLKIGHEGELAGRMSDLPESARERIEAYIALVRESVQDEELSVLEEAWLREKDPEYYCSRQAQIPSSFNACMEAMVGRGRTSRSVKHQGCA